MPIIDPKVKIQTLLEDNWDAANTQLQTPKIHTGWYNASWGTTPQVTVTNPIYSVMNGGETGVTAIGPGGTKVRLMECDLHVDVWAHAEMKTPAGVRFKDGTGINAKALTYDMSNEVQRLVEGNLLVDSELEWMNWQSKQEFVDTRIQPVVFRYSNLVRLVWKETF